MQETASAILAVATRSKPPVLSAFLRSGHSYVVLFLPHLAVSSVLSFCSVSLLRRSVYSECCPWQSLQARRQTPSSSRSAAEEPFEAADCYELPTGLPLNEAQRHATISAMANRLTLVQGGHEVLRSLSRSLIQEITFS